MLELEEKKRKKKGWGGITQISTIWALRGLIYPHFCRGVIYTPAAIGQISPVWLWRRANTSVLTSLKYIPWAIISALTEAGTYFSRLKISWFCPGSPDSSDSQMTASLGGAEGSQELAYFYWRLPTKQLELQKLSGLRHYHAEKKEPDQLLNPHFSFIFSDGPFGFFLFQM